MNPFSDLLHRTPWWILVFGGLAIVVALVNRLASWASVGFVKDMLEHCSPQLHR